MCGIVSIWGHPNPDLVQTMMQRMRHRGPDASGFYRVGKSTVGHRRLSIMDPIGGNQPIFSENGQTLIIANGEIYNFSKLHSELVQRHTFSTVSDSEVVLHCFEDVGTNVAEHLDGMFAFVLTDGEEIYAARDTVGIKPLYYGQVGNDIIFASELKAFAGLVDNVHEFPPGAFYHSATGFQTFSTLPTPAPQDMSVAEMCQQIRETLEQAVIKRLMSDVPLGAFLSGGLDSSLIAAIARQHVDELHTFAVGFEGSSDLAAARVVARHIDSIHHEYYLNYDEIVHDLPEILFYMESFDEDLVRSAVPNFYTAKLAAQYVKVVLTGEGADELFAGYRYFKSVATDKLKHELHSATSKLHNINLQRLDRLTMAHSIEGRVPFLDLEMIQLAQRIPAKWLIYPIQNGKRVEKWILRQAYEDLLPAEIVWRDKAQFSEGSGSTSMLKPYTSSFMSDAEAEAYKEKYPTNRLRSLEECVYHKLLCEAYDNPKVILDNVAHWSDQPTIKTWLKSGLDALSGHQPPLTPPIQY